MRSTQSKDLQLSRESRIRMTSELSTTRALRLYDEHEPSTYERRYNRTTSSSPTFRNPPLTGARESRIQKKARFDDRISSLSPTPCSLCLACLSRRLAA